MTGTPKHVLVIPAWLPSDENPWAGIFFINHCLTMMRFTETRVGVIYAGTHTVTEHARSLLERASIPIVAHRINYIPKATRWLVQAWCRRYFKVFRQYVEQHGRPELLHAHSYLAGFAAGYISKETGIPVVLTEHSTNFLQGGIRKGQLHHLRELLQHAAGIIAVGRSLQKALAQYTKTNIVVIPNPVDSNVFYYAPGEEKPSRFTVVVIGALTPRKRYPLILNAIAALSAEDCQLICVGLGNEKPRLMRQASALGIAGKVIWHDAMAPSQIAHLLRQSHVLVSASETETSGIAVAEALMCGLPVVITASGGPEEYVEDFQGIILPADARDVDIARAIDEVRTHYDRYLQQRIADTAKMRFDGELVAQRVFQVYRQETRAAP